MGCLFACTNHPVQLTVSVYPQVKLRSKVLDAWVYLPDPENGYYRGVRFDWSGQVSKVGYAGHQFFGAWRTPHNPMSTDHVVGPADAFDMTEPPGYADALPGQTFVKIGVGHLQRIDEEPYRFNRNYPLVDSGKWVNTCPDNLTLVSTQILPVRSGIGYRYTKTISLDPINPVMTIQHRLKNTGNRPIQTATYCHNFINIDNQAVGPNYEIIFNFEPKPGPDYNTHNQAQIIGNRMIFTQMVGKTKSVSAPLLGFQEIGLTANSFKVINLKTNAGITIVGDHKLMKLAVYALEPAVCPEPFIKLNIPPGKQVVWKTTYTFENDFQRPLNN